MKKIILSAALLFAGFGAAQAEDFFSTSDADQLFNLGVRVGVNTSNRTVKNTVANIWNVNSWGTGFDAGVVADINFKNYISIQPGFFYESRSGAFAYQSAAYNDAGDPYVKTQVGKGREYLFTVPIVASVHFNIIDELRWNVDFGPYMQFKLKSTFDGKFSYPEPTLNGGIGYFGDVKTSRFDLGFKMGTGLDIYKHYYVGVHYLAGLTHAWKLPSGGKNKSWMFTVGYDF